MKNKYGNQILNWVIFEGGNFYYTENPEIRTNSTPNFYKAKVYGNMTFDEVYKIAKEIYKCCRCIWYIVEYNEAKQNHIDKNYVTHENKTYKLGEYVNIREALKLIKEGTKIVYKYNNENNFLLDDEVDLFNSDVIINASWRIIYEINNDDIRLDH